MVKVIITGASGFIGEALMMFLSDKGYYVYAFQRSNLKDKSNNVEFVKYSLDAELGDDYFREADVLIHTAYQPSFTDNDDLNFDGTKKLVEKCRKHDVKFIFLSSLSAQVSINSRYSKSKMQIEEYLDIERDIILKLGLVIGNGGLFQRMRKLLNTFVIIPIFDGGDQSLQYISISDVKDICLKCIQNHQAGKFVVVHGTTILMRDFYARLAKHSSKKRYFISIPSNMVYKGLRFFEFFKIPLPITSENMTGLQKMNQMDQYLPEVINPEEIKNFENCLKEL